MWGKGKVPVIVSLLGGRINVSRNSGLEKFSTKSTGNYTQNISNILSILPPSHPPHTPSQWQGKRNESTHTRPLTTPTEEESMLRDSVRRFATEEIGPLVNKMDEESNIAPAVLAKLFEQGYMGVEVGQEEGGCGLRFSDTLIIIEEIARVDPSIAALVDIHNTLINRSLMVFGTEEQKSTYLPLCAQEFPGSFCLSESNSGSDAFALQSKATKTEGGWSLNGSKQWISNAAEAGIFIIFATIDPALKRKGITAFLVDAKAEGLTVGRKYEKLGIRASSTCELFMEDIFVPDNRILGEVGKGYKIAIELLNEGRIGIAAQMLGLAEGAFNATVPHLMGRKQFNTFLIDMQAIKFQLAQMAVKLAAARCLIYNAAALREGGHPFCKEAAIAKYYSTTVAEEIASQCVELFGGNGFIKEYPIEKFFRDSKIGTIYEGTSNIQLETIAKEIRKEFET